MLGRTMENEQFRDNLIDRRSFSAGYDAEQNDDWKKLTLAQQFAAASLTKYGYELRFIRYSSKGSTAVLVLQNGTPASISEDGDVNTSPDLNLRQ